jgi:hypothetical protein
MDMNQIPAKGAKSTTNMPEVVNTKKNTKRPQRSGNNPFQSNKQNTSSENLSAKEKKKVNLGLPGETPKKYIPYEKADYSSTLDNLAESTEEDQEESEDAPAHHNILSAQEFLKRQAAASRPKTSRGKHNPSPDEFFDYVIPSPDTKKLTANRLIISKEDKERGKSGKLTLFADEEELTSIHSQQSQATSNSDRHDISDNYLLGLNLDGISRDKQLALLGCWLFGSVLRV